VTARQSESMPESSLWRCPTCGQTFVAVNMPHSCEVRSIETHFAGRPELRAVYDRLLAALGGPVTENVTKSRIAFQTRMRFAGIDTPRRDHLLASFVLTRPIDSPRLVRVDYIPPYYYVHRVRLAHEDDVDGELAAWLAEAREVGDQRHVSDPHWPKVRHPPDWVRVPRQVAEAIARGDDPSKVR
jgi:Domain of unknown function (DUF5655)